MKIVENPSKEFKEKIVQSSIERIKKSIGRNELISGNLFAEMLIDFLKFSYSLQ